ncbi:MAG: DUF948 domain-containing protein [Deltaproteobacteria bacterium]|jgi:uncharacterized protein YoxC
MNLEIVLIIFGIAFLLLVIFCIPILVQVRQTAKDITITLEILNKSLPLLLKNLEDITTNINNSSSVVNREIQSFSRTADRIHLVVSDIVDDVQSITPSAIKSPLFQKLKNVVAIIKGIRVFVDAFIKK